MVTNLAPTTRRLLRQRGYSEVELTEGWENSRVPLYTHKQLSDKAPGDVAFHAHISNPRSLTSAEADYLARKGGQGFMQWKPEECFDHVFPVIEVKERPGGGIVEQVVTTLRGCKWCRSAQPKGLLEGEGEKPVEQHAGSTAQTPQPPPPSAVGLSCPDCHFQTKAMDGKGRPRSQKQQQHVLNMHTTRAHSG